MNGCAPGLALIERLKATRKWAIDCFLSSLAPGSGKMRPWKRGWDRFIASGYPLKMSLQERFEQFYCRCLES